MNRRILVLCWLLVLPTTVAQADDAVPLTDFLVSAKLPQGYHATTKETKSGKISLTLTEVSKTKQFSRVIINTALQGPAAAGDRRDWVKGFVDASVSSMANAGYKVVEKNLPDFDKEAFDKPTSLSLVFANAKGKKLWTEQKVFFTDKGFIVQVAADNAEALANLKKWAKTIKPKP